MPFSVLRLLPTGSGASSLGALTGLPAGTPLSFTAVTVGDDGGEVIEIDAGWPAIAHTVVIVAGGSNYPCYSGRAGEAYSPVPVGGVLRFVIPADLPIGGAYDIEVTNAGGTVTVAAAVNVWRRHRRLRTYDLAALFTPGVFDAGLRGLTDGPVLDTSGVLPAQVHPLKATVAGLGQESNDTNGLIFTRLTAALEPALLGTVVPASALTAQVETTYGFPDAGTLILPGGEIVTYTGRTSTTFTGLTRDDTVSEAYPRGAPVALWTQDRSAMEDARGSLITATAEGGFLDSIGRNYGVGRFQGASDDQYRRLIEVLAYQAGRGTDTAICEVVEVIMAPFILSGTDGIIVAGNILSSPSAPFTPGMVGLRIRVDGAVYLIQTYVAPTQITLAPTASHFWNAANLPAATGYEWEILPCDVLPDPWRPGIAVVRLNMAPATSPIGYGYLQGGETVTPVAVGSVTVAHQIRQVLGVWLATDTQRQGTNYATTNNFAGNVITLDVALPGLVDVVVDYGSVTQPTAPVAGIPGSAGGVASAQMLESVNDRNPGNQAEIDRNGWARVPPIIRYPLYFGDRIGQIRELLRILTAAGIRAEPELRTW